MTITTEATDWPTIQGLQLDAANRRFAAAHRGTFEGELVASRAALRRSARRLFRSHDDAEDAVQSVFLRALERREQFLGGCMACWLHRILTNIFYDRSEGNKRLIFTSDKAYADHFLYDTDPHSDLEAQESFNVIAARPDADLMMQVVMGASNKELAAQFGLSADNVRQTLSRSRRALREILGYQGAQAQGA